MNLVGFITRTQIEFSQHIFEKCSKTEFREKSNQWEPSCSMLTDMTKLFAILRTRLKIRLSVLYVTASNTSQFVLLSVHDSLTASLCSPVGRIEFIVYFITHNQVAFHLWSP